MRSQHLQRLALSALLVCGFLALAPRPSYGQSLRRVIRCGAAVDVRFRENRQNELAKLELSRVNVAIGFPVHGGYTGSTCMVTPKAFEHRRKLFKLAGALHQAISQCISKTYEKGSENATGQGVVVAKFTPDGKILYSDRASVGSSIPVSDALDCVKKKVGPTHSLQVRSSKDVYVLHRWSFTPRRPGVVLNPTNAKPRFKRTEPANGTKAKSQTPSLRTLDIKAQSHRIDVDISIHYTGKPSPKARHLIERRLRKAVGCVVRSFVRRGKPRSATLEVVFSADYDGLVTTPNLVSNSLSDKALVACLRSGVSSMEIPVGTLHEPLTVLAKIKVSFR